METLRADLSELELLTILEHANRILEGTHPVVGPEWAAVAIVLARAAWRELKVLRLSKAKEVAHVH